MVSSGYLNLVLCFTFMTHVTLTGDPGRQGQMQHLLFQHISPLVRALAEGIAVSANFPTELAVFPREVELEVDTSQSFNQKGSGLLIAMFIGRFA